MMRHEFDDSDRKEEEELGHDESWLFFWKVFPFEEFKNSSHRLRETISR